MYKQKKDSGSTDTVDTAIKIHYAKPVITELSALGTEGTKFMVSMSEGSIMIGMGTFSFGPS
jgi:hypothetical protein